MKRRSALVTDNEIWIQHSKTEYSIYWGSFRVPNKRSDAFSGGYCARFSALFGLAHHNASRRSSFDCSQVRLAILVSSWSILPFNESRLLLLDGRLFFVKAVDENVAKMLSDGAFGHAGQVLPIAG